MAEKAGLSTSIDSPFRDVYFMRLIRKKIPEKLLVGAESIALFRLGEQCNNACPMCSNSGRPEAFFQETETLLDRADFLHGQGIERVVLTGGEPTIHPGFWEIVSRLVDLGMRWDINTHGRSFSETDFVQRAVDNGLLRAIVSFHTHDPLVGQVISGYSEEAHEETIEGIRALAASPVELTLNVVLSSLNLPLVEEHLVYCHAHFGKDYTLKLVFPSTAGKGGGWKPIHLRYSEVIETVLAARRWASDAGMKMVFEGFPNCVLGEMDLRDFSRSAFGETHYLEDIGGRELYSMRHIEAHFNVYPESCRSCAAYDHCPGVSERYLRTYGVEELKAFVEDA